LITPSAAKKLLRSELAKRNLPYRRLTARTTSFMDLARDSRVFVTIHGWQPNAAFDDLKQVASKAGFCISAAGFFT